MAMQLEKQMLLEQLGFYYCDKDMIVRAALESGNLTPEEIDEAYEVIPCKVLYAQLFDESCFIDKNIIRDLHLDGEQYIMYVGEVQTILLK